MKLTQTVTRKSHFLLEASAPVYQLAFFFYFWQSQLDYVKRTCTHFIDFMQKSFDHKHVEVEPTFAI